jgi:hypothetical protein
LVEEGYNLVEPRLQRWKKKGRNNKRLKAQLKTQNSKTMASARISFVVLASATVMFATAAPLDASTPPKWVSTAVHHFMPTTAPGAGVLTADGLWNAIRHWDATEGGKAGKFMYGNEKENQYMVAAFLANANQESLQPFTNSSLFDKNYGVSELACNTFVGHCSTDPSKTDPKQCPDTFVQHPSDCTSSWGGTYGLYWGRGALQVTCRKGSGPGGSDFCAAYSDIAKYYSHYISERGWNSSTIELEPWRVALDPTLAWGSAIVYWMGGAGHRCYTCHQWAQIKDLAGTIETINGGWANGEAPLNNNGPNNAQQNRINGFLSVCSVIGLDPKADGWNGLTIADKCPCQRYFNPAIAGGVVNGYCKSSYPSGTCTASTTHLPAGYPFNPSTI